MVAPAINWREIRQWSRVIGVILTIVGGAVLIFQGLLSDRLPPQVGFIPVQATVLAKEQVGTFQNPAFLVTVLYEIEDALQTADMRSAQRVDYPVYRALSEGDTLSIFYNPNNPFEWRVGDHVTSNVPTQYALGVLMIAFGIFSWLFPLIVRVASREADFLLVEDDT